MAVDHEARTQAALANQKVDKHEEHCGERWEAANKAIDGLRQDVKDLRRESKENNDAIHHRINSIYRMLWVLVLGLLAFSLFQWLLAKDIVG